MSETRKRDFKPDLPAPLLRQCKTEGERWMYEQMSIHRQQNEAILERLDEGDARFEALEKSQQSVAQRLAVIERIKERLSAKWAVVAFIVASVLGPVGLALLGAAFIRWFEKVWK